MQRNCRYLGAPNNPVVTGKMGAEELILTPGRPAVASSIASFPETYRIVVATLRGPDGLAWCPRKLQ